MNSRLIFRWRRMIFNHCSKTYYWPFEWFFKSSCIRRFPVCQKVLDISQIAIAFHRVWPPPFIQAWLQQYRRSPFLYSAYRSFNYAISFGSMSVEVQWFHDKSSQDLPNSIEMSVFSTFGACDDSKNFNNLFSDSCEVFVFARIWLNPLSGKILYHDSVPVIVSGFTSLIEDFVVRRYQVTQLFCAR